MTLKTPLNEMEFKYFSIHHNQEIVGDFREYIFHLFSQLATIQNHPNYENMQEDYHRILDRTNWLIDEAMNNG
jgi:hypothetical protein